MGKIIELSQHVSNQIAAGEVVERPLSVVKELLENALDAQAKIIEVRIKNGGFSQLIVQDDGIGMDELDLALSIKRYATSKLSAVSDLERLHTFGFRGEALAAIASVSRMSIISRQKDDSHGNKASIEGGTLLEMAKAGAMPGTRIEVRDLFYNVPARLKFAKSRRLETLEIDRLLRAFAFVHPEQRFKLFSDDKLVFSTESNHAHERAILLLGKDMEGYLYPFKKNTATLTIEGFFGAPMAQRRDSRAMVFFVNNRLVSDKKLFSAIKTAFISLIEVGQFPVCALNLSIAPDEVDVNVHPRKTEVRFKNERQLLALVIDALRSELIKTPWLKGFEQQGDAQLQPRQAFYSPAPLYQASSSRLPKTSFDFLLKEESLAFESFKALPQEKLLYARSFSSLHIIGQTRATYILAENEDGLMLIDQHAAHERIMYERICAKDKIIAEPLLLPLHIPMDRAELAFLEESAYELHELGLELEKFSDDSIIVRTVPSYIKNADVAALIKDIVADLSSLGQARKVQELRHHICATLACHSSIRAGQRLSREEMTALLIELDGTDFGAHCPHGRPIVKSYTFAEMKKWFDRT